jgi:hypothetical protein
MEDEYYAESVIKTRRVTSIVAPVASGRSISPGGAFTHWKAPPLHGARHQETLRKSLHSRRSIQGLLQIGR